MKKILFTVSAFIAINSFAQVGIGNNDPKATLDVTGVSTSTVPDGVLVPRFSVAQLNSKEASYGADQNSALVYITDVTGASGKTSDVTAVGFYYYNYSTNKWVAVGVSPVKDITTSEVVLNKKIDGVQLYAIKGSFTAPGTNALVSIPVPNGMSGYYSFTTYKDGKTFRREVASFDSSVSTNNVVTGTGGYTEIYPAGVYNYVLEYFK